MTKRFLLHGNIIHTPTSDSFEITPNGYIAYEDGAVAQVFAARPESFEGCELYDYGDCLIIPGLCDTHLHAPQFAFRGLGMDLELIEWLNTRAFPEELKYAQIEYARLAYEQFARALKASATTRACVFATVHAEATLELMRLLDASGLYTMVGKVSMDRNAPDGLLDAAGKAGAEAVERWLGEASGFKRTRPILTPRFVPSCTEAMLTALGELKRRYALPLQSHLSENLDEIKWVSMLCPKASCYLDAYRRHGLINGGAVMAHCVYPSEIELHMLKEYGVLVSHCPASNTNLASGIAPIREYLNAGVAVSLGTDIAGGHELSMIRAITDAIQVSKLRSRYNQMREKPLTLCEAFHMATKGGGAFFGNVGSFEKGFELDAVVLDDSAIESPSRLTVAERLERALYLEKDVKLRAKLVRGDIVFGDAKAHKEGEGI